MIVDIENEEEDAEYTLKSPRPWWRSPMGCTSIILFFVFIIGGSALGLYEGIGEQVVRKQAEIDQHYQQALRHIDNEQTDLAIAELNQTLMLDPSHTEARELLRDLKNNQAEKPTVTSESRQNVAADLFTEAKALTQQGNWEAAIELFNQIREVEPAFEPAIISDSLYTANYELGLRLITEENLPAALHAFDEALVERPNDPLVTDAWEKVTLYLSLPADTSSNFEDNIVVLTRLYTIDPDFADVKTRLYATYKNFGDSLAAQNEWCLAQPRYDSALELSSNDEIEALAADAEFRCSSAQRQTPVVKPTTVGTALTAQIELTATETTTPTTSLASSGTLYFSRFNAQDNLWEIIALDPSSGEESILFSDGTQPAISPNGRILVYQSLLANSAGLHAFNLTTGEDTRITTFAEDVLPHWGDNNKEFIFVSQRSGDRRWQIFTGFSDGKGDAVVITEGRTPDLSPNGKIIAYQGTDPKGNNPGIYTLPANGGKAIQLTTNESDRSPAISPKSDKIAYMSTMNGNWDIWMVPAQGGTATPIITSPGNDGLPVWSPDGSQLAFVSDRGGSWNIYIADADGENTQKVADWGITHPDWLMQQLSWGF